MTVAWAACAAIAWAAADGFFPLDVLVEDFFFTGIIDGVVFLIENDEIDVCGVFG